MLQICLWLQLSAAIEHKLTVVGTYVNLCYLVIERLQVKTVQLMSSHVHKHKALHVCPLSICYW